MTDSEFEEPSAAQVWDALRILYGGKLVAATVTLMRVKTDGNFDVAVNAYPKELITNDAQD